MKTFFVLLHRKNIATRSACDFDSLFEEYSLFTKSCENITYQCLEKRIEIEPKEHSFVGMIEYANIFFLTPNDYENLVVFDGNSCSPWCKFGDKPFKFTGECIYDDKLILFPRQNDSYQIIDLKTKAIDCLYSGENDCAEHHYGGVCTEKGIVYQPPRASNTILSLDISKKSVKRIKLWPSFLHMRYCGSILHPNGLIYFLPENGYVIAFNPDDMKWSFIGKKVSGMVYDAKVGIDGNIYGFSGYGKGIVKIDVLNKKTSMLYDDICFGAYGTKTGVNGKMYSVPGNSNCVWEFDYINGKLKKICEIDDNTNCCKYAGGLTSKRGIIYGSPVGRRSILCVSPSKEIYIPDRLYERFYADFY